MERLLKNIGVPAGMNQEDLNELDLYSPSVMYIESLNGERMFKGKVWVLVSKHVYSSSESFASFCKTTGWACRFAWIYGTVQDGTGSEEFGTIPDYISGDGESALDTCLRVIAEKTERRY